MTPGALIFAFNNSATDYVRLAAWNALRIQKWLRLPVTLVTDQDPGLQVFDQVIVHRSRCETSHRSHSAHGDKIAWHNLDRCDAFDITPYDRTLLLDADYVISSCDLLSCVYGVQDFLCHDSAWDLTRAEPLQQLNSFGRFALPMAWATAVIFSRDSDANHIFDCWRMVRDHWQHYRNLYGIRETLYRNDYALTIARSIVRGHVWQGPSIPWHLPTIMPNISMQHDKDTDEFEISYHDRERNVMRQVIRGQDFHAMNKDQLEACID